MFCKRWRPEELLPKADLLSYLLLQHPHIVGVALTGSLARREPKIHDIDLVVFHDGTMEDGSAQDPERTTPYSYNNDLSLVEVLRNGLLARSLSQARDGVPVNYIFVDQKVLWDCTYLRSLEKQERFKEFYLRIFNDIPLLLLGPYQRRGMLKARLTDKGVVHFEQGLRQAKLLNLCYTVLPIRHFCDQNSCKPKIPWSVCRFKIRLRKKHFWHLFS